jgi:serine/threonine protein kinase
MKLVRGSRLDQHFHASSPLDGRLRVFERVCETVAFAHAHGIIHRDLKPENVMVGDFGEVLVLDWGVAKLRRVPRTPAPLEATGDGASSLVFSAQDTRTRQTADGTIIGTPAYMSPEQARGEVDRVDERSDVFALGAILHFLLAGTAPITPSLFERQRSALATALNVAARLPRSAPRALAAVCCKALHPDPAQRYASASQLAAEIARFRSGQRVVAHHEGPLEWIRRLGWKYRTPLLLVLAYLLMRILLAFWGPG